MGEPVKMLNRLANVIVPPGETSDKPKGRQKLELHEHVNDLERDLHHFEMDACLTLLKYLSAEMANMLDQLMSK